MLVLTRAGIDITLIKRIMVIMVGLCLPSGRFRI